MTTWTDLETAASDTSEVSIILTRIIANFAVADVTEAPAILRAAADAIENGTHALVLRNVAGFDIGRLQANIPPQG